MLTDVHMSSGCGYGGRKALQWSSGNSSVHFFQSLLLENMKLHLQIGHCQCHSVVSSIHNLKVISNQAIFFYVFAYFSYKLKMCLLSFPTFRPSWPYYVFYRVHSRYFESTLV